MQTNSIYIAENNDLIHKEIIYLDRIEAFSTLSIQNIDIIIDAIGYLEEDTDPDYTEHVDETVEFVYIEMRVWIDIRLQNDLCRIEDVVVKDDEDNDYDRVSGLLKMKLSRYYALNNFERATLLDQALEIQNDNRDFYNLGTKTHTGYSVNPNYIRDLKSICEDDEKRLEMFLEYGSAGSSLILKDGVKNTDIVRYILPMVKNNIFMQVKDGSKQNQIAAFIHTNFRTNKQAELNISTLKNTISRIF